MTGEEYIALLQERQEAWMGEHNSGSVRLRFPPLLEWFIRPGDEALVELPAEEPQPKPARQPRPRKPVDVDALRARRDRLAAQRDRITGHDTGDRAAANLSPRSRHRAARTAGRRRFQQMDRDLEKYARLTKQIEHLDWRIAKHAAAANTPGEPYASGYRTEADALADAGAHEKGID